MATGRKSGPPAVIADRLKALRRRMKSEKIGAYLVTRPMDYFYLTGFTGEDSAVLFTPREVHVITDGRFDVSMSKECAWANKWLRKGLLIPEIGAVAKKLGVRGLAIQPDGMNVQEHEQLTRLARPAKLRSAPPIVGAMRTLKDRTELAAMNKAIRVAEDAFQVTCASIQVGQTELALAARLEFEMKQRGASGPSFPTIVAEGPNAALPHAHPGRRKVRKGSAILFDWGARVGMYCSDLTRVVFVDSIPRRLGEVYDIVLEAQQRAIRAIRPGVRMCDVDKVARDHIAAAGYAEQFNHGLGHGLGLNVHEPPSLSWRSDEKLVAGMVVTVEPGVYIAGVGGIRIEDDVLVTAKGRRVLSRLGKERDGAVL
jgi:Xaa-Pro aminopeptidase